MPALSLTITFIEVRPSSSFWLTEMGLSEYASLDQNFEATQKLALLHKERERLTSKLLQSEPLNFHHYLHRATVHYSLGYSDLAAADAYRALTLLETYFDPEFSDFHPARNGTGDIVPWPDDNQAVLDARTNMTECLGCLVLALTDLGCLRDAYTYLLQLEDLDKESHHFAGKTCQELRDLILSAQSPKSMIAQRNGKTLERKIEPARLSNVGFSRREIYRWNTHEPERCSPDAREALNELLKPVAPNLEVRCVELPVLEDSARRDYIPPGSEGHGPTMKASQSKLRNRSAKALQLGLFAKADLLPSSTIHHEASVLTAVRPLNASLCHNCGVGIPAPFSPSSEVVHEPICCPSCTDAAVFCSHACLYVAQTKYHNITCGNEFVELLGRDEVSARPSEDLYFLLLARVFAMSCSQNMHPLELPETKYLSGMLAQGPQSERKIPRNLPFTFQHNIVLPFRLLSVLSQDHPEMSPFSVQGLDWYDTWVVQTLYAKFRGVASARQSTWDGTPEVAAVHPLWSLANHSCAPNVEWGWGSERILSVRDRPVLWGDQQDTSQNKWKGIKAGEEILTHYCDIELSVKNRREYMLGSLGGECMCKRCVYEAGQEQH